MQYIRVRSGITEGNIFKFQRTLTAAERLRIFRFFHRRTGIQNFFDTFCCNACSRQHNRHHGQHQERHHNQHRISNKSGHISDLQNTAVDFVSGNPHNNDYQAVHNQHHARHHKGHHPVGKQLCFLQRPVCTVKTFLFGLFTTECPDYRKTCQYFTGYQIQIINQSLHQFEFRHGNSYQHQDKS